MSRTRVFVDTNVILEAFRTRCWTAICSKYAVETVEKCIEEAMTGDPYDTTRIQVDRNTLTNGLAARHCVSPTQIARLIADHPRCQGLDAGELHLLAWLHDASPANALVLLSTADRAAVVASNVIGWLDAVTSLETLAHHSGVAPGQLKALKGHYRDDWLSRVRLEIRLGKTL